MNHKVLVALRQQETYTVLGRVPWSWGPISPQETQLLPWHTGKRRVVWGNWVAKSLNLLIYLLDEVT